MGYQTVIEAVPKYIRSLLMCPVSPYPMSHAIDNVARLDGAFEFSNYFSPNEDPEDTLYKYILEQRYYASLTDFLYAKIMFNAKADSAERFLNILQNRKEKS